jgi:hypothetical protein
MADANMTDLYDRVRRFEPMCSKGLGFEANGTLAGSFYNQRSPRRRGWLVPSILALAVVFALKAGLYIAVGQSDFDGRVERLQAGAGFDRVGGWFMRADPVTIWMADKIELGIAALK